ncbi:macro domain-like protein [Lojkania enalia]|uniref:Macro domain-like protein n=1 Tax=Lojkania enalia TaxID=147567 RepID=A0A9P4K1G5_9PLEO|nr:macro domain-like protein [Didymosphaeria enalia]
MDHAIAITLPPIISSKQVGSMSSLNNISPIPSIHLLCVTDADIKAFEKAAKIYGLPSSVKVEFHNVLLSQLQQHVKFDLIVSPANSYARLDGGFDDALSRAFSPADDYFALTRVAQATVYDEWRGFAPPGTCTLIDLDNEQLQRKWDCRYMALCPTMKVPQDITWDHEVVYECIWSLLGAIDKHNRRLGDKDKEIQKILMTPLATGTGFWSNKKWAVQAVLAIRDFAEALEHPEKWGDMTVRRVMQQFDEIKETYDL